MASRNYYTLIVKYGDKWCPEFGDYNREVVVDEVYDSYADSDRTEVRIIKTGDTQEAVEAAMKAIDASIAKLIE